MLRSWVCCFRSSGCTMLLLQMLLLQMKERPHVQHAVPRSWNSLPALSRGRTTGGSSEATQWTSARGTQIWSHCNTSPDALEPDSQLQKPMEHLQLTRIRSARNIFARPPQRTLACGAPRVPRATSLSLPGSSASPMPTGCARLAGQCAAASTSSGRNGITRVALGTSGFDGSSRTSTMSESRMRSTRQLIS